jgi:hypothetical protein
MVRKRIKDVRENIQEFHEYYKRSGSFTRDMYIDQMNHIKNSGLQQSDKNEEIEKIKVRYKEDIIRYIEMFSPFYVGKSWYNGPMVYLKFRISNVDWEIVDLEKEDKCPIVKSITIQQFDHRAQKKEKEWSVEYPETDEGLLSWWESAPVDADDDY